jgi:hypothetical protein
MASPAERDEYCEYFGGFGAITCRVLYRTEQLVFVQFRTVDWLGYKDFSNYARVALFPEHLRPADAQSPGVVKFVQAIAREVAAPAAAYCQSQPSGDQRTKGGRLQTLERNSPGGNGAKPAAEAAKLPARSVTKPSPAESTLARASKASKGRGNRKEFRCLKPVRSIAGPTIADFLFDR